IFSSHSFYSFHPIFFFQSYGHHRYLHSFPTRRSSDLRSLHPGGSSPWSLAQSMRTVCSFSAMSRSFRSSGALASDSVPVSAQYRSEEHTSELQSRFDLVCRLLLEKKKNKIKQNKI